MATQGFNTLVDVSDDGGTTWTPVGGINDISFSPKTGVEKISAFNQGSSAEKKMLTTDDGAATLNGDHLVADAGQVKLRTARASKTTVRIRFKYDGATGDYVDVVVPSIDKKSAFGGKVTASFNLEFNGLPTAF